MPQPSGDQINFPILPPAEGAVEPQHSIDIAPQAMDQDGVPRHTDKPLMSDAEREAAETKADELTRGGVPRVIAEVRENLRDPESPRGQVQRTGSSRQFRRLTGRTALIADKIPYRPAEDTPEDTEEETLTPAQKADYFDQILTALNPRRKKSLD